METEFEELNFPDIEEKDIKITKAKDFVLTLKKLPFFNLISIKKLNHEFECIVIDVEVERAQLVKNDIRKIERIGIIFDPEDKNFPTIIAFRKDFPLLPHMNHKSEKMKTLCLFDEDFKEVKFRWTSFELAHRIREWLARAAAGNLHLEDQPLEPLMRGTETRIILPPNIEEICSSEKSQPLIIRKITNDGKFSLIAYDYKEDELQENEKFFFSVLLKGEPQTHGIIENSTNSFHELSEFFLKAGINLIEELRKIFKENYNEKKFPNFLDSRFILLVYLPKKREEYEEVEATDFLAFSTTKTIKEIGIDIGIFEEAGNSVGLLISPDQTKTGYNTELVLINPILNFSRNQAAQQNGTEVSNKIITAVGLGALGSQLFLNCMRSAYGRWNLIDDDILLPHNLARHALFSDALGINKAHCMMAVANITLNDNVVSSLNENILEPKNIESVNNAFNNAEIILDMSASVPVARSLVYDYDSSARRIAFFLNPSATDSVLLVEDVKRHVTSDLLEMVYYKALIRNEELHDHLKREATKIRYANSCRDINVSISQNLIALHAAIGSSALQNMIDNDALITIWKSDKNLNITKIDILVPEFTKHQFGEWTLFIDKNLLNEIYEFREYKLPNETGGILIGSYDMQRKIVYVVDTIYSPPDSLEWPTLYIRGCQGLSEKIKYIKKLSNGMLRYIGEWHSHPKNMSANPSEDDKEAFRALEDTMSKYNLPTLMLIAGVDYKFFLNTI